MSRPPAPAAPLRLVVDGLIFQKDPYGGVARLYREVLPRLCDQAPDLQVTLFIDGPLRSDLPAHDQIQVQRAPAIKRTVRVQGLARRLLYPFRRVASRAWNVLRQRWLGAGQGAIWHSTFYTLPTIWKGAQAVMIYDMIAEQYPEYYPDPLDEVGRRQKRACVAAAQAVLCISEATRREAAGWYPQASGRMVVTHLAYSQVFRPLTANPAPANLPDDTSFLLYVGGRALYKNFEGLLEAYRVWPGREAVALCVVGGPWSEAEQRRLRAAGLEERVLLRSGVDDESLARLYNRAVAFVYPSRCEGFGIPLLEAMACGCPVVASDIPAFREVAQEAAYYFPLDQPAALLAALDQALTAGRGAPRVAFGLARAQDFSWDKTAAQMLAIYRSIQP